MILFRHPLICSSVECSDVRYHTLPKTPRVVMPVALFPKIARSIYPPPLRRHNRETNMAEFSGSQVFGFITLFIMYAFQCDMWLFVSEA